MLREQDVAARRKSIYIVVTGDGGFDALFDFMRGQGCAIDKAGSIPEALALAQGMQSQTDKPSGTKATEKPTPPRATLAEEDSARSSQRWHRILRVGPPLAKSWSRTC